MSEEEFEAAFQRWKARDLERGNAGVLTPLRRHERAYLDPEIVARVAFSAGWDAAGEFMQAAAEQDRSDLL